MHVSNGFNDLLMMSTNLNGITVLNINGVDYCCIISEFSISEAVNLLRNADSRKKWNNIKYKFSNFISMNKKIITFGETEISPT